VLRRIYLDHNATTPLHPEALEAMMPFLTEEFGNASSVHALGRAARDAVEAARDAVAALIGADPSEIVFTGGGTESDNAALHGVLGFAERRGKRHLLTTAIEHHAVLETAKALERAGTPVTYVGVDSDGRVDAEAVAEAIRDDTALVSVMHANNETGALQPVAEAARAARERGVLVHTDAVQTAGRIPVAVDELGVDLLSLSAHKFGGPKGVGALYVRRGTRIVPFHHGGAHERNRRGGTENVPGIVGLGKAAALARAGVVAEAERLRQLTSLFLRRLAVLVDDVRVNSPAARVPGTVNVSFAGVEGESLILALDLEGICVSSGSACASGSMEPSHVLAAMRVPPMLAQGTVRFSFGRTNTEADVEDTAETVARLVARSRRARAAVGD
jgi:cysteine desulfurase